jgi:xylan 1,4-beta-xylosidase
VLAVWNYAPPEKEGAAKTVTLKFKGTVPSEAVVSVVDPQHGDVRAAYEAMGSPQYPTQAQIKDLRKASELAAPETRALTNGELTLTLPSYALALVRLK